MPHTYDFSPLEVDFMHSPHSMDGPRLCLTKAVSILLTLAVGNLPLTAVWAEVAIEMVTVGDAGNIPNADGLGAVPYTYRIGTYEVSIGQYTEFLNAAAASDPYGLYNDMMARSAHVAGIEQLGASGSYTYRVLGSALRPITYVSWWDAARFCNWLHNGQGSGSTEEGAYRLKGAVEGIPPQASEAARFTIPTEHEWFKAAFYKGGSTHAGYWTYATQSDEVPGNGNQGGKNRVNYRAKGRFCTTQKPTFSKEDAYLTDAGLFSESPSAYGTFDQQGNVQEWNDLNGLAIEARGIRGGSWYQGSFFLNLRNAASSPNDENNITGFRVASPHAD